MNVNSLPKTVTRQRRDCDLNPCRSAPESSTLTTRLLHKNRNMLDLCVREIADTRGSVCNSVTGP